MENKRMTQEQRRQQILEKALEIAEGGKLETLTMEEVAKACNLTRPAVKYYFFDIRQLREEVVAKARHDKNARVLAQALMAPDAYAQLAGLSQSYKNEIMKEALKDVPSK